MREFFSSILLGLGINDVVDIIVVAFVLYKIIGFIRKSRAEQLVKGLLIVVLATVLSDIFRLHTLNWILRSSMAVGVIALVIVFQPELRRGLESLGRSNVFRARLGKMDGGKAEEIVSIIQSSLESMSKSRTGALIVIERATALTEIADTAIKIDGSLSQELIENIFYEGAPLHDGAVILREDRVYSAGCVLPLTQNSRLPSNLGTRHRAGIGITEHSDAVAIMVSEETGYISVARDGLLFRNLKGEHLQKMLIKAYVADENEGIKKGIKKAVKNIGGSGNVEK